MGRLDGHYLFLLQFHWERQRDGVLAALNEPALLARLENCNQLWLKAINTINARNHPYLTRDYHRLVGKLSQAFDAPAVREELLEMTRSVLDRLVGEHFQLWVQKTTSELARAGSPMRMPFLVRSEFPEFLEGDGSVARFLYGESHSSTMVPHKSEKLDRIANAILQSSDFVGAHFLTAILAAANGAFDRASQLMARAEEFTKDKPPDAAFQAEIDYFDALLRRLNVNERKDYDTARSKLNVLIERVPSNTFDQVRAYSESAALELQWFGTDAMKPANRTFSNQQISHLKKAETDMSAARALLPWSAALGADRFTRELAQQIVVNEIALNAYRELSGEKPNLELVRWALQQFEALSGRLDGQRDYITELWVLMATWLVDRSPGNARAVRGHCERVLNQAVEITAADSNDLERIKSHMEKSMHTAP
jgi:hypothetical protein